MSSMHGVGSGAFRFVVAALVAGVAVAGVAATAHAHPLAAGIVIDEQRIEFAPGTDNAIREGRVDSTDTDRWTLRASAGQVMDLSVDSVDDNIVFAVIAPDGSRLAYVTDDVFWSGLLPTDGDYRVEIASVDGSAFYRMKVWIDAGYRDPLGTVQRMSFAAGTDSATASGAVVRASTDWWALGADAGQTMQVDVTSLEGNSTFDVLAPDGTLLTAPGERTTWTAPVPQSGDYFVVVQPTRGNATYTITVRITGGVAQTPTQSPTQTPPPPPAAEPPTTTRRISFAPGTDNLAVSDSIAPSETHLWLVDAAAGQTLAVFLESDVGDIWFDLRDPLGGALAIMQQEVSVLLIDDGDHVIEITNQSGIVGAYNLTVFVT